MDDSTVFVKVSEDYSPDYDHVILYDDYAAHPDAPVFITSDSKDTFEVALTSRVSQLINAGVLAKAKGKALELPVDDNTEEPKMNDVELPNAGGDLQAGGVAGESDNTPNPDGDGKTVQRAEAGQEATEKAAKAAKK